MIRKQYLFRVVGGVADNGGGCRRWEGYATSTVVVVAGSRLLSYFFALFWVCLLASNFVMIQKFSPSRTFTMVLLVSFHKRRFCS